MKYDTKPWFDIDVSNAIRNCHKRYKIFKQSGKDTDNDNFKYASLSPKIMIIRKKLYFKEKIAENKHDLEKLMPTLKSLTTGEYYFLFWTMWK